MKKRSFWSWLWIAIGTLYFILPLYSTFDFSLRARKGVLSFLAYERIFKDPNFWSTIEFSLVIAIFTIIVSILLVVPTAYWIRLRLPKLRVMVEFISMLPFVVPAIVLVFGLIRVFSGAPFFLTNTYFGTYVLLVAGYVVLALPFVFRAVDTGLAAIDVRSLTEAAQSLGANWGTIIFRVIFPNLRVAILSSAFLTLATVIGEYTIASFLVGIKGFGPYMSLIGQNKTYESSSLAIISFLLTWAFMGMIQLFNRGKADTSALAGAR
ncbi:MAG: ABC transporter permease subunit [Chloroflexi bacterium]|nr:spermidine/putrescine ABC transporter permease [Anaerolinea sp.]TDA66817.1 MAG: ABC transporter permease subunit [Chloroflexota bacterium]